MKRPFLNQEQRLLVRLDTANGATLILALRIEQFIKSLKNELSKTKIYNFLLEPIN